MYNDNIINMSVHDAPDLHKPLDLNYVCQGRIVQEHTYTCTKYTYTSDVYSKHIQAYRRLCGFDIRIDDIQVMVLRRNIIGSHYKSVCTRYSMCSTTHDTHKSYDESTCVSNESLYATSSNAYNDDSNITGSNSHDAIDNIHNTSNPTNTHTTSNPANTHTTSSTSHSLTYKPLDIQYEVSLFNRKKPRSFTVVYDNTLLHNKEPFYNGETSMYSLNFGGRVTVPSVKNFQLVHPSDKTYIILTFGKIDKDTYILDYKYPLSAVTAFGICLSALDKKWFCN